jgi:hypothetical protein
LVSAVLIGSFKGTEYQYGLDMTVCDAPGVMSWAMRTPMLETRC